jgi:peptide/nickel transport system substrate-binding protein
MDADRIAALIDDVDQGRISRRDLLRAAVGLGVSAPLAMTLLQACAPAPTATEPPEDTPVPADTPGPAAAPSPTTAPVPRSAIIGMPSATQVLDPFFMNSADLPLMGCIYDSLFDLDDKTLVMRPVLVEEWEQLDDLTWAFKLKEGVQFHKDWGEMTADDWAYWVNRVVAEQARPYYVMGSGMVKEAVVTGTYDFEIHLSQPWAAFALTSLVNFGGMVFSSKAYEDMGAEEFGLSPIGTGPFEIESWTPGGDVVLKRFEDYHDPNYPKLDELIFQGIEDRVVRLEKLRNGEIDWTLALDMKDIPQLRDDPNLQVLEAIGWNWDFILFNLKLEGRPWQDQRVRQAISYAVDREAIVQGVYYGNANPEDDPLPSGFLGGDPDQQFYPNTADLETAMALMEDAGYAEGFTMPCLTSRKPDVTEVVADQLRKIGITLEIELVDSATQRSRYSAEDYETQVHAVVLASPDPDSAMYWWYHSSGGGHTYSNPEVDEKLDAARASSDPEERKTLYREIVEIVSEEAPKVILCNVNEVYVLNSKLTGFEPAAQWPFSRFKSMGWSA